MSIKTEIDRIKQSKADIISALKTKGVTVPTDASIDDLSALVQAIEVGSDPVLQSKTVSPSTSSQTVKPDTGYDGLSQVTVNAMTTATQATPSISVSSSGLITAKSTQTAGYVSAGTKSATKQLTTKGATTWTPKTSNQTISSGTYLTGTQTIKGDSNLVASNIKSGVSIFGVTGSVVEGITPTGELAITENGTFDVTNYASALVNVASSGGLQVAEGTFSLSSTVTGQSVTVATITGLPFEPQIIAVNWVKAAGYSDYREAIDTNNNYHIIALTYKNGGTITSGANKVSSYGQYIMGRGYYGYIIATSDGFIIMTSDISSKAHYPAGLYEYIAIG